MAAIANLLREFRQTAPVAGRSAGALAFEALRLRLGPNRLGLSEYLDYRAWLREAGAEPGTFEYIGARMSRTIDRALNAERWRALANDKLLCLQMLTAHDFPVPETIALYCPYGRTLPGAKCFTAAADFISYLAEARPFPAFAKPIQGTYGRAAFLIVGHDPASNRFALGDGSRLPAERLLTLMEFEPFEGFLLQQPIAQHADLSARVGSTICSVRLMVLFTRQEPEAFCAFWKVATASNMTDNFSHGSTGNAIGWVDVDTGQVIHLVSGVGHAARVDEDLPQPMAELVGRPLPNWKEASELACRATRLFPGLGFQHWDLAFSTAGPLLVEVNTEPDLGVPQICAGRGLLDARLKEAIEEARADQRNHQEAVRRAAKFSLSRMVDSG